MVGKNSANTLILNALPMTPVYPPALSSCEEHPGQGIRLKRCTYKQTGHPTTFGPLIGKARKLSLPKQSWPHDC